MAEGLTVIARELYHGLDVASVARLHIIGLCFSSLSFLSSCTSIYWMIRMRRSFRHDLIVLLIVSDLMKSLWLSIYDSLAVAGHQLPTDSSLCQLMGFLFSMGLEAADAAVFLIALHSTIYIFWPNRAGGESGLYPYRYMAYCFFLLWPVLMASLAFVKGIPAYVSTGQSCYLPPHPWWYRTMFSWIPRCLILLVILVMYGSSYAYVRLMIRRYSRRGSDIPVVRPNTLALPPPPLVLHGLVPPSNQDIPIRHASPRVPAGGAVPQLNIPSTLPRLPDERVKLRDSLRMKFNRLHPGSRGTKGDWNWMGFDTEASMAPTPGSSVAVSPMAVVGAPGGAAGEPVWVASQQDAPQQPRPQTANLQPKNQTATPSSEVASPASSSATSSHPSKRESQTNTLGATQKKSISLGRQSAEFYRRPVTPNDVGPGTSPSVLGRHSQLAGSQVHIRNMLRNGPRPLGHAPQVLPDGLLSTDDTADWASTSSSRVVVALDQEAFESGGISRSRDRMRRQLRLLFVYPAVYACVWIFPFISDLTKFQSPIDAHDPFWLLVVSLVSLCSQGLCDTIVFCLREQPWRHMREGGFWDSFGVEFSNRWQFSLRKDSGRTREEMFNDGTRARCRRDEERDRENEFRGSPGGRMPATAGGLNWWDVEVDGSSGDGQGRDRKEPQGEKRRTSSSRGGVPVRPPLVALDGSSRIASLGAYLQT